MELRGSQEAVEAFYAYAVKENCRVSHEWDQWDGTPEHAERINDAQCARLMAERARLGLTQ